MSVPQHTQLGSDVAYQEAAISAVLRAFKQTHGIDFASAFVREHQVAILNAINTHLCGRAASVAASETLRLSSAYVDV